MDKNNLSHRNQDQASQADDSSIKLIIGLLILGVGLIALVIITFRLVRGIFLPSSSDEMAIEIQTPSNPEPTVDPDLERDMENPEIRLRNIDGVPLDWEETRIPDLDTTFRRPPDSEVRTLDNGIVLIADSLQMSFINQVDLRALNLEKAVSYRNSLSGDYGDVLDVEIAAYDAFQFNATDNSHAYVLVDVARGNTLMIEIDATNEAGWEMAEDVLASLKEKPR